MYQKPMYKTISRKEMEMFSKAGACVLFYTGCGKGYNGCVYKY